MKFALDVDRIEIANEDYRLFHAIGDEDLITATVSLGGVVEGGIGARVIMQITVPYENELSNLFLKAKRDKQKLHGTLEIS